jgi:hypothetical protein
MTLLRVDVYGLPAPQGSKRHVGGGRMIEASKKVGPWREAVVRASTLDALTTAEVIVDDSRVVAVWAVKKYAKAQAGAVITIESYEELD